jgi:hypothetical protein
MFDTTNKIFSKKMFVFKSAQHFYEKKEGFGAESALMTNGSRMRILGSVPLTNGSGTPPKSKKIRIQNKIQRLNVEETKETTNVCNLKTLTSKRYPPRGRTSSKTKRGNGYGTGLFLFFHMKRLSYSEASP